MYVPSKFLLDELAAWEVVREAGAGMLVVATDEGLASVFVPVVVKSDYSSLTTHVARANPWWKNVTDDSDVLAIFLAASAYVTPSYYPSRYEQPGVVPTWNYVAVEVRGTVTVRDDAEWTSHQVRDATSTFERKRSPQWYVDDAPADFIEKQLRAIVGLEITVSSIEGKSKLSQNRPQIDHGSVRDHLAEGSLAEQNVAARMHDDP